MAKDLLIELPLIRQVNHAARQIYIRCCKSNSGGRENPDTGSHGALRHHQSTPRDGGSRLSCFAFVLLSLLLECRDELWGAVVWEAEGTSKGFAPCRRSSGVAEGH